MLSSIHFLHDQHQPHSVNAWCHCTVPIANVFRVLFFFQEMAQRLLDYGDFNVIAVDWRYGSLPMYQQALSNTQLVAMETAHLIKWLQVA